MNDRKENEWLRKAMAILIAGYITVYHTVILPIYLKERANTEKI